MELSESEVHLKSLIAWLARLSHADLNLDMDHLYIQTLNLDSCDRDRSIVPNRMFN